MSIATTPAPTAGAHPAITLLSRLLVAWLFLPAGIGKIAGFAGTVGYIASKGLPAAEWAAALTIVVEVGGSLLLIAGFKTRWAAWVLAFFTLAAAFIFHNYWGVPAEQVAAQQINFSKNIAIAGGLLAIAAWGAGAWSVDARRGR